MRGRSAAGMPAPVSSTAMTTREPAAGPARTVTLPPRGVYLTALSTRLIRIWARRSRSACTGGRSGGQIGGERDAAGVRPWPDDGEHRFHHVVHARGLDLQDHATQLDVGEIGEIVEQAAEPLGVAEDDLEEAARVLAVFERAAQQRLQIALDGGE